MPHTSQNVEQPHNFTEAVVGLTRAEATAYYGVRRQCVRRCGGAASRYPNAASFGVDSCRIAADQQQRFRRREARHMLAPSRHGDQARQAEKASDAEREA